MAKVEAINARDKGEAPLSIGTSLALESLCGFGEFPNENPHLKNIDELWVNLKTLFRNFFNSIDKSIREQSLVRDFIDYFVEDLNVLVTTIENKSFNRVKVKFIYPKYTHKEFTKLFPNAIRKLPKTPNQIFYNQIEEDVLHYFISNEDYYQNLDVMKCDFKFKQRGKLTCLLTHYPVDLLNQSSFIKLWLLESHSGGIKGKDMWYTKLTQGNKLLDIPFNKLTMQVLGDGNTMFSSMNHKTKEHLFNLAAENNWTSVTTEEKIKFGLNKNPTNEYNKLFKTML